MRNKSTHVLFFIFFLFPQRVCDDKRQSMKVAGTRVRSSGARRSGLVRAGQVQTVRLRGSVLTLRVERAVRCSHSY